MTTKLAEIKDLTVLILDTLRESRYGGLSTSAEEVSEWRRQAIGAQDLEAAGGVFDEVLCLFEDGELPKCCNGLTKDQLRRITEAEEEMALYHA